MSNSPREGLRRDMRLCARCLLRFEIIAIHAFEGVGFHGRDADIVLDHQGGHAVAVDEHDLLSLLADLFHILVRLVGEFYRGDKNTFARAFSGRRADKGLKFFSTNRVLPALGLQVDRFEPEAVFIYDAVDAFVGAALGDLGGLGAGTA